MTHEQTPKLWECPACGFTMAAKHHDPNRADPCPACAELDLRAERSQLTETIALDMRTIDRLRAENAGLRAAVQSEHDRLKGEFDEGCPDGRCDAYHVDEYCAPCDTLHNRIKALAVLLAAKPAPVAGE